MDDLEITTLCAKAMALDLDAECPEWVSWTDAEGNQKEAIWDPLGDDSQAMALVKHFMLTIEAFAGSAESPCGRFIAYSDDSLNRAIVECVAKMQVDCTAQGAVAMGHDESPQQVESENKGRDAERYRWLKENDDKLWVCSKEMTYLGSDLDEVIDAMAVSP